MGPKKKGKKGKKNDKVIPDTPDDDFEQKDPETLLQEELDSKNQEFEDIKVKVNQLKKENEWLYNESHRVRIESLEYMNYIEKKTSKRQTTIITLSDHNQREIYDLLQDRNTMLNSFNDKKKALQEKFNEKQFILSKTKRELTSLQKYKDLQKEQTQKIAGLQQDIQQMRGKHSQTIMHLKTQFLGEKKQFIYDSASKIVTMAKEANQEATQCLNEHTHRMKTENRRLRHVLLQLIHRSRALQHHKDKLIEQKNELKLEQKYANDLKVLRSTRQFKVMKSMSKYADNQPAENDATSGDELDDTAVVQGPRQQIEIDENILLPLRKLKILSQ